MLCHPFKAGAIVSARTETDKPDSATPSHLDRMDSIPETRKADIETGQRGGGQRVRSTEDEIGKKRNPEKQGTIDHPSLFSSPLTC